MTALQQSYLKAAEAIRARGSVWVQTYDGKWYHTYDRATVSHRIALLTRLAGGDA